MISEINIPADLDFKALESDDDRFLNQIPFFIFANLGALGDSKSDELAVFRGFGPV